MAMANHFALLANQLLMESTLPEAIECNSQSKYAVSVLDETPEVHFEGLNDQPAWKLAECRICQDEDLDSKMETPCSCRGSLKYAHRRCVQRWCDEKGNTQCEICQQQFRPGYTASRSLVQYNHIPSDIRRNWEIGRRVLSNSPIGMRNAGSEPDGSLSRSMRCLAVAIIFMVLLVLRHMLPVIIYGPDCCFPLITLVVLRIAGCALLLYIILAAVIGMQHHQYGTGDSDGSTPPTQDNSHVILQVE